MKKILLFSFIITLFVSCNSGSDEVNIFPIQNPTGIGWCKYKITKMISSDSTPTLQTGKIVCIKCKNPNKNCLDYKKFKYGAYEMEVERVAKPCSSCPNSNFFDVGGPI